MGQGEEMILPLVILIECPFLVKLNKRVLSHLTQKAFEFAKAFEGCKFNFSRLIGRRVSQICAKFFSRAYSF
jgi:hypothetical protein